MRLLTNEGWQPVRSRSWPLRGIEHERTSNMGWRSITLVDGPGGRKRFASYDRLYRENPYVFSAVNVIANGFARLPVQVKEYDENGDLRPVDSRRSNRPGQPTSAEMLDRLLRRPNPTMSGQDLRYSIQVDRSIYGNALVSISRNDATNQVDELWHVPWSKVAVHLGRDEPILGYEITGSSGRTKILAPDEVIHFGRGNDPLSPLGLSPMVPLAKTAGLMDAIKRFLVGFFQNQARPSGNFKLPPGVDDEVLRYVREQIADLYASPEQAGKPLVTTGEWQTISTEPRHSQVVELNKLSREEVSAVMNVPMPFLGDLDRAIFSNIRELREYLFRDVVGPVGVRFEDDIATQLLSRSNSWRNIVVEVDFDEMLRPDLESRAATFRSARLVYTLNELREREGLPRIDSDAADAVMVPPKEKPLGEDDPGRPGPAELETEPEDDEGDAPAPSGAPGGAPIPGA